MLPIIGLSGRVDWGKRPYDPTGASGPSNGGIVGTVSYDTTRNELDPRYAAAEDWQPGISGLTVKLYAPVDCGTNAGAPCDPTGWYEIAADGSYAKGKLLNTYVTEAWQRPTGCVARDVDGVPLVHGVDENVLPTDPDAECLEGPLMGVQFGTYASGQGTADANFGANVDGNYGFGDGCFNGTSTPPIRPLRSAWAARSRRSPARATTSSRSRSRTTPWGALATRSPARTTSTSATATSSSRRCRLPPAPGRSTSWTWPGPGRTATRPSSATT